MTKRNSCDPVIEIIDRLLGPKGCPWDWEQTLLSLRESVLEEACELIDAINSGDKEHICEEIGDLFFNALFFAKVAEKEGVGTFDGIIQELADKLIRRHPHVFGEGDKLSYDGVISQWERIKKTEKGKVERVNVFDGIPAALPSLARGQKMAKKIAKSALEAPDQESLEKLSPLGAALWKIVQEAHNQNVNAEQELRLVLQQIEKSTQPK